MDGQSLSISLPPQALCIQPLPSFSFPEMPSNAAVPYGPSSCPPGSQAPFTQSRMEGTGASDRETQKWAMSTGITNNSNNKSNTET